FNLCARALALKGSDRPARMSDFVQRTGGTIIVTLGPDGAIACSPDGTVTVPALPIRPLDTVGAGDTFCGYFGASLDAGLGLEDALRRAVASASIACLKWGAQPAIPNAAEVEAALR